MVDFQKKIFGFAEEKGRQHCPREDKGRWLCKERGCSYRRGAIRKQGWEETEERGRGLNRCYEG